MWKHYRHIRQVKTHVKGEAAAAGLQELAGRGNLSRFSPGPTYKDHVISYIIISFFFFLVNKIGERVTYLL